MTRRALLSYIALCLLAGSGWILDQALPPALPGALGFLVDGTLLTLSFGAIAKLRLPSFSPATLACCAIVFALPGALAVLAQGRLSDPTIVLIYTLVPAATIFFAAQTSQQEMLPALGPALAALTGAALILPFTLPSSLAGRLFLAAVIASALAVGFAGLRLHTLLQRTGSLAAATLAACATVLVALPLYGIRSPLPILLSWRQTLLSVSVHLLLEAATIFLTVRLLRDLTPIAFSTRYLLIPLVTIGEGYLILRPTPHWTLVAGVLLLVGGSSLLLRGDPGEHQT